MREAGCWGSLRSPQPTSYNLFGGGYVSQAEGMIGRLVSEAGEGSY